MPVRNEGVGLQLRGHICGLDDVRSEMGFDVKVKCFTLHIQIGKNCVQTYTTNYLTSSSYIGVVHNSG